VDLNRLLNKEEYLKLLYGLGSGKIPVIEYSDWLKAWGKDSESLGKALVAVGRALLANQQTILYPLQLIVVPRYPFSKEPMIQWRSLQLKDPNDIEVTRLKEICGRLANLINVGFILRGFILVDIDGGIGQYSNDLDIKTRRGFHKIFYIDNVPGIEITFSGVDAKNYTPKWKLQVGNINIEIMSGPFYLGSHPLQSRYLEISNGKINVLRYKCISKECEYAFRSADLSTITYKTSEAIDWIRGFLNKLGLENYSKNLKYRELTVDRVNMIVKDTTPRNSRFNENHSYTMGGLDYTEFKDILAKQAGLIPNCIKRALYEQLVEGERYCLGRLLAAVTPFFIYVVKGNLENMAKDFAERSGFKDAKTYYWKYFMGTLKIGDEEVGNPSLLGVPKECWEFFKEAGYCETCPLYESCSKLNSGQKRQLIVDHITGVIERALGEAP